MNQENFWAQISLLGLFAQIGITGLLLLFFLLLKRHSGRRSRFFTLWTRAWGVLLAALGLLAFGLYGLPLLASPAGARMIAGLYPASLLLYQTGKLLYLLLLLGGFLEYLDGRLPRRYLPVGAAVVGGFSALSFLLAKDLNELMLWQSPLCIVTSVYASVRCLGISPQRRGIGARFTGGTFMLYAVLWAVYGMALWNQRHLVPLDYTPFVNRVANYNGYLDALVELLLAFGMVLLLLEEARRETNAAHAELAIAHAKLLHESLTDPLTGVYNRLAFTRGVYTKTARTTYGAVVVFDLDNLKQVNDRHSHEAGDELIKHFVSVLRSGLRPSDQLYRWGGDEFLLLVPGAGYAAVGPRLNDLLREAPPLVMFDGIVSLKLEVSMGGADYADLEALRESVGVADRAMYEQKRIHKTAPRGAELRPDSGDTTA